MNEFPFYDLNPVRRHRKTRPLYRCSKNPASHRLTLIQAKNNGWMCSHCGAELANRKNMIARLEKMAIELGYKIEPSK